MTECPTPTKTSFRDRIAAELAVAKIGTHRKPLMGRDSPCRAYRCPCGKWHLTTKARRPKGTP